MNSVVNKLIKNSGISADEIAGKIIAGAEDKIHVIVTHARGRKIHRLKRYLPKFYLKKMAQLTQQFSISQKPKSS